MGVGILAVKVKCHSHPPHNMEPNQLRHLSIVLADGWFGFDFLQVGWGCVVWYTILGYCWMGRGFTKIPGGSGVPGLAPHYLPSKLLRQVAPRLAAPVAGDFGAVGAKSGKAPGFSSPGGDALSSIVQPWPTW